MDCVKFSNWELDVVIKHCKWVEGMEIGYWRSDIRVGMGSNTLAAWVIAMYLDSVVDKEMRACLGEFQETALLSMQNAYPEMVCQCSCEFPFTSLYPSILN